MKIIYMSTHENTRIIYMSKYNNCGGSHNMHVAATVGMVGQKAGIQLYRTCTVWLTARERTVAARLAPGPRHISVCKSGLRESAGPTKSN